MATQELTGLLADLGLGPVNEQQAFQAGLPPLLQGSGTVGNFMQLGQKLGRGIGPGVAGIANVIGERKDDDSVLQNFQQGAQRIKDEAIARGLGMQGGAAELQRRRTTRQEISRIDIPSTGDPIKDQQAALSKIIEIAQRNGDTAVATRALQKQVQLAAQKKEFDKLDVAQRKAEREEAREIETDSVGRSVILQGDNIDDPHSKAMMNDDGTWTVVRPDGEVQENVPGIQLTFVDPAAKAAQRDRFFETEEGALKNALSLNFLNASSGGAKRTQLENMADQAVIVGNMADTLNNMFNPAVAFAESAKATTGADKVFTFVETVSTLFDRAGDEASDITYNDKKVPIAEQYRQATNVEHYESFLREQGLSLRDVLPAHIQADTKAAQLFAANIMQLAYLDARLQEPSNRGLSDNDVQNALKRIGAAAPNPAVFAERQIENIRRLQGKMGNLGIEFAPTSQISKQRLIDHVYTPESRALVNNILASTQGKLNEFLSGDEGGGEAFVGMSDEELDQAIAEEEARSAGQQ